MKKMVKPVWILLVFLVVLSFVLAGCKPSVTGRLAGGVQPLRYQQLFACEQGGRPMIACRTDSAITVEQYRALVAQAGGQDEQPPNEPEQDEQPPAPPGGDEGDQGGAPPGPGAGKVAGEACANNDECIPDLYCLSGTCKTQTCSDTDPGNDPAVPGILTLDNLPRKDGCVDANQVNEWFCTFPGVSARTVPCPQNTTCQLNVNEVALCQAGVPPGGAGAGKVAGEACANNDECAAGLKCMYQVCQTQSCTETDAENLPLVAGVVTLDNSVTADVLKKDECVNANQIREWFCPPDGGANARAVACPPDTTCQLNANDVAVCQGGAPPPGGARNVAAGEACTNNDECIAGLKCLYSVCQTQSCSDTDSANDPAVPGTVTLDNSINPDRVQKDTCVGQDRIQEYACGLNAGFTGRDLVFPCPQGTTCQLNANDVALCQAGAPPGGPAPGSENGPCIDETFCDPGLQCANRVCIALVQKARDAECPSRQNAECQAGSVCRRLFVRGDPTTWSGNTYFCKAPMPIDGICERPDQCIDTICRNNLCVDRG